MATTKMSPKRQTLDALRQEIDAIDDALHDLLMRRAEVTRAVAEIKRPPLGGAGASAMRPAREAQILRRLLARHHGDMPAAIVVRIWREIIAASLQAQAKFHLHVFGGEHDAAFFDLAHAYFGAATPLRPHAKASLVVHACAEEPDSLGIVPVPDMEGDDAPWWAQLSPAGQPGPRVIARLPFIAGGEESQVAAYALGCVEQEPSGDDTTLLRLETAGDLSRARMISLLKDAGFEAAFIASARSVENGRGAGLLGAAGFVAASDPRLTHLRELAGEQLTNVDPVGGFANPFVAAAARDAR